jgi:hypothetical protein
LVVDEYFKDTDYVSIATYKNILNKDVISISAATKDFKGRKYKFTITGNGTVGTKRLLISLPEEIISKIDINNKPIKYGTDSDSGALILFIDAEQKEKTKKSRKTDRRTIFKKDNENQGLYDPISLNKKYKNQFNGLYDEKENKYNLEELQPITKVIRRARLRVEGSKYEPTGKVITPHELDDYIDKLRNDLDSNNKYRYEITRDAIYEIKEYFKNNNKIQEDILNILKDIYSNTQARLDFLDRSLSFLSPICKAIDKLEDKIDSTLNKNTSNISEVKDNKNSSGKIIEVLLNENITIKRKLEELENKVKSYTDNKNTKEDKRSLFGKVFGE